MGTSEDEKPSERHARQVIEAAIGRCLTRVPPSNQLGVKSPDYTTEAGRPVIVFEVKELTVQAFRELHSEFGRAGFFRSDNLTLKWSVLLEAPTLADGLSPPPNFPPVDPAAEAHFAAGGMRLVPPDERRAQWIADQRALRNAKVPRLKGLGADIEPDLMILEAAGLRTTRTLGTSRETMHALARIRRRTGGSTCMGHEPHSVEGPGVEIAMTTGYARTGRADAMLGRLAVWLASDEAQNLCESLDAHAADEHHAVIVIEPRIEPEWHSRSEAGAAFAPSQPLELPKPLDALWIVMADLLWCYRREDRGWEVFG